MVYCVTRCIHIPHEIELITFTEDSLLTWVQNHWLKDQTLIGGVEASKGCRIIEDEKTADRLHSLVSEIFPFVHPLGAADCFIPLIRNMGEMIHPPKNVDDLEVFLTRLDCFKDGEYWEVNCRRNAIQGWSWCLFEEVFTYWYLFDDEFARNHSEVVSILLQENNLPEKSESKLKDIEAPIFSLTPDVDSSERVILGFNSFHRIHDNYIRVYEIKGVSMNSLLDWFHNLKELPSISKWQDDLLLLRACTLYQPELSLEKLLLWIGEKGLFETPKWSDPGLDSFRRQSNKPRALKGQRGDCLKDFELYLEYRKKTHEDEKIRPPVHLETKGNNSILRIRYGYGAENPTDIECDTYSWTFLDQSWIANNVDLANSIIRYGQSDRLLFDESERLNSDRNKYLNYNGGRIT